ncbi:hypothetical protein KBB68_01590 [Candidatus Babeliales bacterium]|nr:hypothetical protein [Candidatus Babeliales bacterium]
MCKFYYFGLILLFVQTLFATSACIIIHGTWAQSESWHQPHGDFFKAVYRSAQEIKIVDQVVSFPWSAKLSYHFQMEAAVRLQKLIESYDSVILIGHSHGATVAILTSQLMGQKESNFFKIKKLYALGVPVDPSMKIYPDMQVIEKFYNLFSFGDMIQPVNGAHDRTFASHERLANISVMLDDQHPSHGQLHDPMIGKDLLKIDEFFVHCKMGNFENFLCNQPGMIRFFKYAAPQYALQHDQTSLLELDKQTQWMMTMAFFRNQQKIK